MKLENFDLNTDKKINPQKRSEVMTLKNSKINQLLPLKNIPFWSG